MKTNKCVAVALATIGVGLASHANAAVFSASNCRLASVQNAVNRAVDGDVVKVPAGRCTWDNGLTINDKTITLRGAGSGNTGTRINYGGAQHSLIAVNAGQKTGKMEITGFRFIGGDANYWNGTAINFYGPREWRNIRIHHNVFDNNKQWAIVGSSATYGVIDSNTFRGSSHGIILHGAGIDAWNSPAVFGSADFFFVEGNTFNWDDWYGSTGAANVDNYNGARVVFRNNNVKHGFFETHDSARNGADYPSANAWEVYNNTFSTATNKWKGVDLSAGTGVVWGNNFIGDYTVAIGAMDYKSFDPRGLPLCDGNDPNDQNTPGESGWLCQFQLGSQGYGATATSVPAYVWNNVKNGVPVGMACTSGCQHLVEGRDFINNTPRPNYTPFVYPHPLRTQ